MLRKMAPELYIEGSVRKDQDRQQNTPSNTPSSPRKRCGSFRSVALVVLDSTVDLLFFQGIMLHGILIRIILLRAGLPGLSDSEALVAEDLVHVFETSASSFRVEEVSDGHEAGVEDRPDDVQLVSQVSDRHGCDVDDDEVGQPMAADTQCHTFVSGAERHDFGRVHPADGQDTPGEDVEEEEAEGYEDPLCLRMISLALDTRRRAQLTAIVLT